MLLKLLVYESRIIFNIGQLFVVQSCLTYSLHEYNIREKSVARRSKHTYTYIFVYITAFHTKTFPLFLNLKICNGENVIREST